LLLDHGADPDGAGPEGLTALMLAAMLDRVELIDLLLERALRWTSPSRTARRRLSMALGVGAHAPHSCCCNVVVHHPRWAE